MKHFAFLTSLLFLTITIGCKKETTQDTAATNTANDVTLGNDASVKITSYDTIIKNSMSFGGSILLDIDNNGVADIKLENTFYSSMGGGGRLSVLLSTLNNDTEIAVREIEQSLYRNSNVVFKFDSINNVWERFVTRTIRCTQKSNLDTLIETTKSLLPKPFYAQEVLKPTSNFSTDTFLIKNRNFTHTFWQNYNAAGDTLFSLFSPHVIDCDVLPLDENLYVGVRLKSSNKLGWIKLKIDSRVLDVYLTETGIQQ